MSDIEQRREQAFPRLSEAEIQRISRLGQRRRVEAGQVVAKPKIDVLLKKSL